MALMNWLTGAAGYVAIGVAFAIAVLAHFLAPKAGSALAWVIAFGLLAAAFVGQRELTAAEVIAHQKTKTANAEKWTEQERLNTEAERLVNVALQAANKRQGELNADLTQAHAATSEAQSIAAIAAARERTTRGQLRSAIVQRAEAEREARRYQSELATSIAVSAPTESAALLCADVLGRIDERAGELAAFADTSRVAGLACEREHDAAVRHSNAGAADSLKGK